MRWYDDDVELLIMRLQDRDANVREWAAEALGEIGDEWAVVPLCEALGDEDEEVRERAAEALGEIGRREALPALQRRLRWLWREWDRDVRKAICAAIEKIEEVTKHTAGLPRGEGETLTPTGRPRAAEDAPTAAGRPREG